MKFNIHQAGMSLGALFAIMHLGWLILLTLGFGQWSANTMHSMHFMEDMHRVGMFGWGMGIFSLIGAFVSGYLIGAVFAWLWNAFAKR